MSLPLAYGIVSLLRSREGAPEVIYSAMFMRTGTTNVNTSLALGSAYDFNTSARKSTHMAIKTTVVLVELAT